MHTSMKTSMTDPTKAAADPESWQTVAWTSGAALAFAVLAAMASIT